MSNNITDPEIEIVAEAMKAQILQAYRVAGICLASSVDEEEGDIRSYRRDVLALGTRLISVGTTGANVFARLRRQAPLPAATPAEPIESEKRMADGPRVHNI